jgi:Dolichyl-phosphate-mannose-protein mannosyltransferase
VSSGGRARTTGSGAGGAGALRVSTVMAAWLASRFALMATVVAVSYLVGFDLVQRHTSPWLWAVGRFVWADSFHYLRIAQKGYLPPGLACCDQAFFPGYPGLVAAVRPVVGGNPATAGVVVAVVASTVAAVGLWRLAEHFGGGAVGVVAVGLLMVAPYGAFLTSVFTESTFLALAVWAWWCGRTRRWWWAGALAGGASLVRINGLFLAAGLAVLYLVQWRSRHKTGPGETDSGRTGFGRADFGREWLGLLAAPAAAGGFVVYLWSRTGSWTEWSQAQVTGWDRRTAWPWQGVAAGWRALTSSSAPDMVLAHAADFGATMVGLVLVGALLWRRWWGEAVYVGLNVAVLVCSTTVQSASRYALVWFPGYVLAAVLAVRWWCRAGDAGRGGRGRAVWMRVRGWVWPAVAVGCAVLEMSVAVALAAHLWVA